MILCFLLLNLYPFILIVSSKYVVNSTCYTINTEDDIIAKLIQICTNINVISLYDD